MNKDKKKILYISYDGMTDSLGQSQVIPYLAGLSAAGYEITILSFEKKDVFQKGHANISAILKRNDIEWVPLFYTKKPPVLSTLWDVWQMMSKANKLHQQKNFALVHCRSYISALAGMSMQRRYGIKFVFDMRGFWADERIDGNIWTLTNPIYRTIYRFFKNKEKQFLENADRVITLTHAAKQEIHTWKNISNNPVPITVIPCCVDMDKFSSEKVEHSLKIQLKKDLGIKDGDYVLSYLGSLGTWYMLDEMLDFFKVLLSKKNSAKLLFVTNTPEEEISQAVSKKGIDSTSVIITCSSFDRVPTYLSLSDSSIFFIKPAYSKKGSSPIKQGELMSMGIPVVCNSNVGDTEWIVRKYHSGTVVDALNVQSYEKAADELLSTQFDKAEIIRGSAEYFALKVGVGEYLNVYRGLLDR
jgi:glycosyltransferase involved in cell wall biosynthesis